MAGRLAASLKGISLIRVFLEQRLHRLAPVVEILLQQFLRRRDAARDRLFQRPQIARLVAAVAVEPRPPLEAGAIRRAPASGSTRPSRRPARTERTRRPPKTPDIPSRRPCC